VKKKKKQKALAVPGWISEIQRSETECHSPSSRAKHDLFEGDVPSTEEHVDHRSRKREIEPDNNLSRAREDAPKLDPSKLATRRALRKSKKPKRKPKKSEGFPGAKDLDKKTRWTPAPSEPFTVSASERKKMASLLSRRTKEQKALKAKLGEAFVTAYTRYRVNITPSYAPVRSEMKLAEDAGVITFLRELTPGKVIAYWHEHIGDFTQLKAVPLRFLASPTNIDQVALVAGDGSRGSSESRPKGKSSGARVHSYGDSRALDSRLRVILDKGGFDVSQFSDRDLMSIQNAARAKASGKRMFVSSKLKEMVKLS